MIERREGGHGTPVCFPDEAARLLMECMSWKGGEMAVGALLRTWGAGGGCKPEMQLFGFFSRARSVGFWWVGGVYCWGF